MSHPAIRTEGLGRSYHTRKGRIRETTVALQDVSLEVQPGELFGLLGPNGAGKTTLIKILVTLLLPTRGRAWVDGLDVATQAGAIRQRISMVSGGESSGYGILTVREQLWMFAQLYGVPTPVAEARLEALLKVVGLWAERDRKVSHLSTGMRQKLNLCRGLLSDPTILFLDEPTVGLDVGAARDVRGYVREWMAERPGRTILLTTHYMQEADQLCDRVAIIHLGQILACDRPQALKSRLAERAHYRLLVASRDGPGTPLQGLPGLLHVDEHDLGYETELDLRVESDGVIAEVVQALAASGQRILSLQKVEPTLEDVFVEIVGKSMRQAEAEGG